MVKKAKKKTIKKTTRKTKVKKSKVIKYMNVTNSPETALHIMEINGDTESLVEALGITKERAVELELKCQETFKSNTSMIPVLTTISKECKHANELYFVSMIITLVHQRMSNPFAGARVIMLGGPGKGGPDIGG